MDIKNLTNGFWEIFTSLPPWARLSLAIIGIGIGVTWTVFLWWEVYLKNPVLKRRGWIVWSVLILSPLIWFILFCEFEAIAGLGVGKALLGMLFMLAILAVVLFTTGEMVRAFLPPFKWDKILLGTGAWIISIALVVLLTWFLSSLVGS